MAKAASLPNPSMPENGKKRKKIIIIATIVMAVFGLLIFLYWAFFLRNIETTDDAYVGGNIVQITPRVTGTITTIHADNMDFVKAGATLLELDPTDAKLTFERACANLAQTVRQTRGLYLDQSQLKANLALNQNELNKAKADLARRKQLVNVEAATPEEIAHAKAAVINAEASYQMAHAKLAGNQVLLGNNDVIAQHPAVLEVSTQVREAYLNLQRSKIISPVEGYLAQRLAQVGQRVNIGQNLMAVVPLTQLWVDANFKETQLANIRIGQPVKVTADIYGSQVQYTGKVYGLGIGSGSAFSLLPAQNATGNWIKVVQRVPVRIVLDPKMLKKHPLRIGLSMTVDVDTSTQGGQTLANNVRTSAVYTTPVFEGDSKRAEQVVHQIILENVN